jgi:acyl-CoA synthetase (NDP forming)
VEILKDVRFAIVHVNESEAKEMVTEIKAYPLLAEIRGIKPSDIDALIDVILSFSKLVCDFPEIEDFEIDPIMIFEDRQRKLIHDP